MLGLVGFTLFKPHVCCPRAGSGDPEPVAAPRWAVGMSPFSENKEERWGSRFLWEWIPAAGTLLSLKLGSACEITLCLYCFLKEGRNLVKLFFNIATGVRGRLPHS